MNVDLTAVGTIMAIVWTAYQEYRINRMCANCPLLPVNAGNIPPPVPPTNFHFGGGNNAIKP
jgi:hypothetical protein